jgi:hypothetical protein
MDSCQRSRQPTALVTAAAAGCDVWQLVPMKDAKLQDERSFTLVKSCAKSRGRGAKAAAHTLVALVRCAGGEGSTCLLLDSAAVPLQHHLNLGAGHGLHKHLRARALRVNGRHRGRTGGACLCSPVLNKGLHVGLVRVARHAHDRH